MKTCWTEWSRLAKHIIVHPAKYTRETIQGEKKSEGGLARERDHVEQPPLVQFHQDPTADERAASFQVDHIINN